MLTINARNVNEAFYIGSMAMSQKDNTVSIKSRAGEVIEYVHPVCTTYRRPKERMLFSPTRNANPFFHVIEALWILAGRKDVDTLTTYNARMLEFSDDGKVFHAPYGHRLRRKHTTPYTSPMDQLRLIIRELKKDPSSRRAVATIFDPIKDLHVNSKDIPCNDLLDFKIDQNGRVNLNVYCRSNDMIWGAYGANVVQFSFVLQYIAEMLDRPVGVYRQISSSFHIYNTGLQGDLWEKLKKVNSSEFLDDPYETGEVKTWELIESKNDFDKDLEKFFNWHDSGRGEEVIPNFENPFFTSTVMPLVIAWKMYKEGYEKESMEIVDEIDASDIRLACTQWLTRTWNNRKQK